MSSLSGKSPKFKGVLRGAWLLGFCFTAGCGGPTLSDVWREQSVPICLKYLAHDSQTADAEQVRRILDKLRYHQARAAKSVFAYEQYLTMHPEGRYVSVVRDLAAAALFKRADLISKLEVIVEIYGNTSSAAVARKRLAKLKGKQLMQTGTRRQLKVFLRAHPGTARALNIRRKLAQLSYERLGEDVGELTEFMHEFASTRWAELAKKRLRHALKNEIVDTCSRRLLTHYADTFADDTGLPQLRDTVTRCELKRALSRFDPNKLQKLAKSGDKTAIRAIAHCESHAKQCDHVRELAISSSPWNPGPLVNLQRELFDPDLTVIWAAIAKLSQYRSFEAGDLLMHLIGELRPSTIWIAQSALRTWLFNLRTSARQKWLKKQRRAAAEGERFAEGGVDSLGYRPAVAFVLAISGSDMPRAKRALEDSLQRGTTQQRLSIAYLLTTPPFTGRTISAVRSLLALAKERVEELSEPFTGALQPEVALALVAAEREMFAIWQMLMSVTHTDSTSGEDDLSVLIRTIAARREAWGIKLIGLVPGFEKAHAPDVGRQVSKHNQNRVAALKRLFQMNGWLARTVAQAQCGIVEAGPQNKAGSFDKETGLSGICRSRLSWSAK